MEKIPLVANTRAEKRKKQEQQRKIRAQKKLRGRAKDLLLAGNNEAEARNIMAGEFYRNYTYEQIRRNCHAVYKEFAERVDKGEDQRAINARLQDQMNRIFEAALEKGDVKTAMSAATMAASAGTANTEGSDPVPEEIDSGEDNTTPSSEEYDTVTDDELRAQIDAEESNGSER